MAVRAWHGRDMYLDHCLTKLNFQHPKESSVQMGTPLQPEPSRSRLPHAVYAGPITATGEAAA
jgi:hypothetical protein